MSLFTETQKKMITDSGDIFRIDIKGDNLWLEDF